MTPRPLPLALLLLLSPALALAGTGYPQGFSDAPYGPRFTLGTAMAWAPDGSGRLFVTRQGHPRGQGANNEAEVRILRDGQMLATPFAVVTPVLNWSECGLYGIAFDPNFTTNGYVYFSACVSSSEQQIIRYTAVGDVGTNKTIIMAGLPSAGDTHNGGGISVGPDGKLYFAIGDNRAAIGPDADLTSLRSKVGRANLDGTVPNDNPFYDGPGPNNDFIWARGMRNPFTHTWQPGRNLLWVNDVGGHGEQVFQVNAGEHGGWQTYGAGNQPLSSPMNYIRPVFMLQGAGPSGAAITGSTFYDGTLYPQAYRGNYFVGDFEVPGRIVRAVLNGDNTLQSQADFATNCSGPLNFKVGPDGALYYLSYDPVHPATTGGVYRIDFAATQQEIVLDKRNVLVWEGGNTVFSVRLAIAPSSPVTVTVTRSGGDADLSAAGGPLVFTPTNWSTPQNITVAAADDADTTADTATFSVAASGLSSHTVTAQTIDINSQGLVLSTSVLSFAEGASASFTVRLASMPAAPVTVTVMRSAGDSDVTVSAGATLTFDGTNYQTPQTVTLAAGQDTDTTADQATFTVTAAGTPSRSVTARVTDDDNAAPAITSTPVTTAVAGINYSYDVEATGLPAPSFSLPTAPTGMTIDATTGVITWVPMMAGSHSVVVRAANGQTPDADQAFTLTVTADTAPYALLTQPRDGATVMGHIEFYGDGHDDAQVVRAEFYVDDVLVYTDSTPGDHFHYGGVNGHTSERYDTRQLTDGTHMLRMNVYDARNQVGSAQAMVTVLNTTSGTGGGQGGGAAGTGGGSAGTGGGSAGTGGGVTGVAGGTAGTGGGGGSGQVTGGVCGCSSGEGAFGSLLLWSLARRRRRAAARPSPG